MKVAKTLKDKVSLSKTLPSQHFWNQLTMHFLTLWQASPQFLGVLAKAVGKMKTTIRRRFASCIVTTFPFPVLWIETGLQLGDLHNTGNSFQQGIRGAASRMVWVAGRGLTAQLLWQQQLVLAPNQPTCSLNPRAFQTDPAQHSFTSTNGALHYSMMFSDIG